MQLAAGSESLVTVMSELKIVESSFIARVAARKLRSSKVAIVIGQTIHLHNTTKEEFLNNQAWVRHEMVHLEQFKRYGTIRFLVLYLLESIRRGYWNNRFEKEARESETNEAIQFPRN